MTQGYYLKKFQKDFSDYIEKTLQALAAALEIIAALLKIKNEEVILLRILIASAIPFARNGAKWFRYKF